MKDNLTQDRTVTIGDYKFDEIKHVHSYEGKTLYGVTTVLKIIGKGDVLVQWSANEAVKYIRENAEDYTLKGDYDRNDKHFLVSDGTLEQAKKAWCSNRDKAGGFGTAVHDAIEKWIKTKEDTALEGMELKAFNNFKNWATENNIEFLESERHVYSKEMWVGGILDLVFKKDGKIYIGDIKTSSGIYPEYFYQMGAYDICLQEMGMYPDVDGYTIINLKKDGGFAVETNYGRAQNQEAFKHALALFKLKETTDKTVTKPKWRNKK